MSDRPDRSDYFTGKPSDFKFPDRPVSTCEGYGATATPDGGPTCGGSVGPRTWKEAVERGLDKPPYNFRREDF